jgi:hypothetical protein
VKSSTWELPLDVEAREARDETEFEVRQGSSSSS